MTNEEKLEFLKNAGVTVLGDFVLEKTVENEFGVIESGGIGVQIVNGGSAASKRDGRKKVSGGSKIVDAVFTYRFLEDKEGHLRIVKLYQLLIKAGWIDKDSKPEVFCDLFMGEAKSLTIKWIGRQQK